MRAVLAGHLDQLICASLYHTDDRYEVGIPKVLATKYNRVITWLKKKRKDQ